MRISKDFTVNLSLEIEWLFHLSQLHGNKHFHFFSTKTVEMAFATLVSPLATLLADIVVVGNNSFHVALHFGRNSKEPTGPNNNKLLQNYYS